MLIWESISTIKCYILISDKDRGEDVLMWQWKWLSPSGQCWGFSLTHIDCGAEQLRDSSRPAIVFVTVRHAHTQRGILCVLRQLFSQRTNELHRWEDGNNPAFYYFLTLVDKLISKSSTFTFKLMEDDSQYIPNFWNVLWRMIPPPPKAVVKETLGSISETLPSKHVI